MNYLLLMIFWTGVWIILPYDFGLWWVIELVLLLSLWEMGISDVKSESWEVGKSKNKVKKDDDDDVEGAGCWIALRSIRSCISSRSKVDNSISGISVHGKNHLAFCIYPCSFDFYDVWIEFNVFSFLLVHTMSCISMLAFYLIVTHKCCLNLSCGFELHEWCKMRLVKIIFLYIWMRCRLSCSSCPHFSSNFQINEMLHSNRRKSSHGYSNDYALCLYKDDTLHWTKKMLQNC